MIQVKTAKNNGFELTDKQTTVLLSEGTVSLGSEKISDTGEYELGGVEVVFGQNAALVIWEQLQFVYVFNLETPNAFEKEQFSSCDVVVLAESTNELNKVVYSDLMSSYDPSLVIFHKNTAVEKAFRDGLKITETNLAKVSEQSLPTEGRDLVVVG